MKSKTLALSVSSALLFLAAIAAVALFSIPNSLLPDHQAIAAPLHAAATPPVYTHLSDLEIQDWLGVAAQTAISVTMNGCITPTGTYQLLESAANVSTSNLAAGTTGQLLILVNTADTTITITDTGTLKLSGNAAITQYDTLTLISDGTNWLELSVSNN